MRYQIRHARVQFGGDVILRDVNFEVHDREKIAIVGRNGCGKTTLLRLIAGDIEMSNLDSDEECGITMAGRQEIGFLRQVNFVDAEVTVEDELKKVFVPVFTCEERMKELEEQMKTAAETKETAPDGALLREYDRLQKQMEAMRGYSWRRDMETMFQRFGFALEDLRRPIGSFSGGQQTKVAFIKLLLTRPDIMLLDEPTNHLDLPTIEWLENYLKGYDKAVVIVSHDRMFLDKVADVTYEIEYHEMKRYPGNYTYFMQRKQEDLIKQEKDYEEQQKEIKRLTDWIEKWKNTPTKVAATRSKRMAIEHMVKIEKPRRFDTRAFHGRYTPRIESYTNVIQAKDLSIGYDAPLAEVSFLLQKKERLAELLGEKRTVIFYEAPHKLRTTLDDLTAAFGEDRSITLCRELTKLHEEIWKTTLGEAQAHYAANEPRGEYVLVMAGAPASTEPEAEMTLEQAAQRALELTGQGFGPTAAAKAAAQGTPYSKSEVYKVLLTIQQRDPE